MHVFCRFSLCFCILMTFGQPSPKTGLKWQLLPQRCRTIEAHMTLFPYGIWVSCVLYVMPIWDIIPVWDKSNPHAKIIKCASNAPQCQQAPMAHMGSIYPYWIHIKPTWEPCKSHANAGKDAVVAVKTVNRNLEITLLFYN